MKRDDKDWMAILNQGDLQNFRAFVDEFKHQVYGLAYNLTGNHHDAEDLSQEVFIRVHKSIGRFRGDAKLSSWLYRIAVNLNIDRVRRKRPDLMDNENLEIEHASSSAAVQKGKDAAHETAMVVAGEHIEKAIDTLPNQQRTVFVLRHYHEMPLKEIADILGVSDGTVKSSLYRAVRALRDRLAFYRADLGLEGES